MGKVIPTITAQPQTTGLNAVKNLTVTLMIGVLGACSSKTNEFDDTTDIDGVRSVSQIESSAPDMSLEIPEHLAALPQITRDDLAWYADPIAGFVGRVPLQWKKVVISDFLYKDDEAQNYAITFESELSHAEDTFADYLMIEMTPGAQANAFLVDPEQSIDTRIDGAPAKLQMLHLDKFEMGSEELDLVVFQLTISQRDYSIGIYAVGKREEASRLHFVMQEFVRSFRFPVDPYRVS